MTSLDKHIKELQQIKLLCEDPEELIAKLIIDGRIPSEHHDIIIYELQELGRYKNFYKELIKQGGTQYKTWKPEYKKPEITNKKSLGGIEL